VGDLTGLAAERDVDPILFWDNVKGCADIPDRLTRKTILRIVEGTFSTFDGVLTTLEWEAERSSKFQLVRAESGYPYPFARHHLLVSQILRAIAG
jgi:hypothetical protein